MLKVIQLNIMKKHESKIAKIADWKDSKSNRQDKEKR